MLMDENEKTINFKSIGTRSGKVYEGRFTFKCLLTNMEQVEVALRTDRYNGGSSTIAPDKSIISRAIAELEIRTVDYEKSPSWFRDSDYGRHLVDNNVLFDLFAEAMKAEKGWADDLKEKADQVEKDAEENQKKVAEEASEA